MTSNFEAYISDQYLPPEFDRVDLPAINSISHVTEDGEVVEVPIADVQIKRDSRGNSVISFEGNEYLRSLLGEGRKQISVGYTCSFDVEEDGQKDAKEGDRND